MTAKIHLEASSYFQDKLMLYLDKILDKPLKCGWDPCVPIHEHRG